MGFGAWRGFGGRVEIVGLGFGCLDVWAFGRLWRLGEWGVVSGKVSGG